MAVDFAIAQMIWVDTEVVFMAFQQTFTFLHYCAVITCSLIFAMWTIQNTITDTVNRNAITLVTLKAGWTLTHATS